GGGAGGGGGGPGGLRRHRRPRGGGGGLPRQAPAHLHRPLTTGSPTTGLPTAQVFDRPAPARWSVVVLGVEVVRLAPQVRPHREFVAERGHERGQLARPQFPDEPPELGHRLPRVGRLDRQVHAHQPGLSPRHPAISSRSPPPAGGGTWQAARWSSTMPVACIRAYAVVGPTNRKPRRLSSFAIATDSGVVAG